MNPHLQELGTLTLSGVFGHLSLVPCFCPFTEFLAFGIMSPSLEFFVLGSLEMFWNTFGGGLNF